MNKPTIAFIGAGNMAGSLIGGLIADQYPADNIWASNPLTERLAFLKNSFHIATTNDNKEAANKADVLVFSVKPSELKPVVIELQEILHTKKPLVISIVTGILSSTIAKWASDSHLGIVRCMPNTPALLRCGTTGLFANDVVTQDQRTIAESILRSVGTTLWFDKESDLDIVTAISGSGPAYFFYIMECIKDYAQKMGLGDEAAQILTVNTALGAARMALESDKEIETLREQVTSKGGTTEQAIKVFEQGGLRALIEKALGAAHERAQQMSNAID
jgi:pyrroline-5-carboxylate reductase